jgi:threonine dehydratase
MTINAQLIEEAAARLGKVVAKTPLQFSKRLSQLYDAQIYIKREDLQEVRSFKIRGAFNKISSLTDEEKKRGIVCASAGNHAQGVAWSCDALKIKGAIFMPAVSPNQKVEKVRHFGGEYVEVILTGETFDDAYAASQQYAKDHNAVYVHPFNDPFTIAGQGTIAKEINEELDGKFDVVIAPIGGGGLISGISTYVKEKKPEAIIMGVEPAGAAEMYESLKQNKVVTLEKIDTFVDGCAVKTAGDMTFAIAKKNLEKIIVVPEGKVCTTMIELYQRDGIIAEPSGALSISALDDIASEIKGKIVVCILSGGNNDILRYPEIMERSLVYQGRKHYFIIEFAQKPGQLKKFLNEALGPTDDISRFEYIKKTNKEKGPALVGVELKNKEDLQPLIDNMNKIGLNFHKLTPDQMLYGYLI